MDGVCRAVDALVGRAPDSPATRPWPPWAACKAATLFAGPLGCPASFPSAAIEIHRDAPTRSGTGPRSARNPSSVIDRIGLWPGDRRKWQVSHGPNRTDVRSAHPGTRLHRHQAVPARARPDWEIRNNLRPEQTQPDPLATHDTASKCQSRCNRFRHMKIPFPGGQSAFASGTMRHLSSDSNLTVGGESRGRSIFLSGWGIRGQRSALAGNWEMRHTDQRISWQRISSRPKNQPPICRISSPG